MWNELETQYGIFEQDWAKYDTKHLVWSHPHCPPGSLEALLKEGFALCYWRALAAAHGTQIPEQPNAAARFDRFAVEPVACTLGGAAARLPYLGAS